MQMDAERLNKGFLHTNFNARRVQLCKQTSLPGQDGHPFHPAVLCDKSTSHRNVTAGALSDFFHPETSRLAVDMALHNSYETAHYASTSLQMPAHQRQHPGKARSNPLPHKDFRQPKIIPA